jgi:hypothetical protein
VAVPLAAGDTSNTKITLVEDSDDIGSIYAVWTDPAGTDWLLSNTDPDYGAFTTNGIAGWGGVPIEIITDPLARGGEQVRTIRTQPRRLTWPLHIYADTHTQFITRYRALLRAFTMTTHRAAPGVLTVWRPDGTGRQIEAYYEDGFGGETGQNWLSASPVLTLFCPDGYWRAINPTTVYRSFATGTSFLVPFPTVSSSQVLGRSSVDNPGEVAAWPTWVITGPATKLVATNRSTADAFTLTYTLTAGQAITITTNRPTVRGPAGQNLTSALDWPGAVLWALQPGSNDVEFTVEGAGPGTAITLSYFARFEGA